MFLKKGDSFIVVLWPKLGLDKNSQQFNWHIKGLQILLYQC